MKYECFDDALSLSLSLSLSFSFSSVCAWCLGNYRNAFHVATKRSEHVATKRSENERHTCLFFLKRSKRDRKWESSKKS